MITLRPKQALVRCKACGAAIPSLTRGKPLLPFLVHCIPCGIRKAYRPADVYIGTVPQVWKH